MRERSFTYVLYIVLMLCFAWGGSTEGYAQRALKHRKGLLNADSIRAQNVADSLALLDTLNIRQKRIEELEAPVDTARLMRQSDSLQSRKPVTINGLSELDALLGIGQRVLKGPLGDTQRLRRDTDAAAVQRGHGDLEAVALLAQQVLLGHLHVVASKVLGL